MHFNNIRILSLINLRIPIYRAVSVEQILISITPKVQVAHKMPLYIQNPTEVRNEDDGPLPANTPSTGSIFDNSQAVECGNRVLELIEKHKKGVQLKMADNERGIRTMLESHKATERVPTRRQYNTDEPRPPLPVEKNRPRLSKVPVLEKSKIVQLYRDTGDDDKKTSIQKSHAVRASLTRPAAVHSEVPKSIPVSQKSAVSDEYLKLPGNSTVEETDENEINAPQSSRIEQVVYEPDEASDEEEIEECYCSNDQRGSDEDNSNIPNFKSRVQFQVLNAIRDLQGPSLIYSQTSALADENEPAPSRSQTSTVKPESKTSVSTAQTQQSYSKRDILSNKRSSRRSNFSASEGVPPSDHNLSTASSNATAAASRTNHTQSSFWNENGKLILAAVIVLIFLIILVVFLAHRKSTGSKGAITTAKQVDGGPKTKANNNKYYGPVM